MFTVFIQHMQHKTINKLYFTNRTYLLTI